MFLHRYLPVFVFLFVLNCSLNAQLLKQDYFRGRIIDDSTGNRVSWVHIFNESRREWYTSDGSGRFSIPVNGNDTLVFRAMGFLGKVHIVDVERLDSVEVIRMLPRYYEIGEVAIRGYRSYESFMQEFKTYRPEVTEQDVMRDAMYASAAEEGRKAFEEKMIKEQLANSGQYNIASIPILSKEDKFLIRYKERLEQEEVQRQIDKKYNRDIVASVTGLPENEITDFMAFCSFSTAYLQKASDLDIILKIRDKLALYLKLQKSSFMEDLYDSRLPALS